MNPIALDFFARDTLTVARELIGMRLSVGRCVGRIVETEAYTTDAASHFVIRRHRATLMRETFGRVYVYLIYGMYHCLNFTTDSSGPGAVLIRAIEPLAGVSTMLRRRGPPSDIRQGHGSGLKLANGPGKLCQALGIDLRHDGQTVGKQIKLFGCETSRDRSSEDSLQTAESQQRCLPIEVGTSPRIGITQAIDLPWRFFARGNPHVSPHPRKFNVLAR
jgi:DNA-3-methyladenine glycosylase